uniref:heterogeneous nuclear ribonucleoprotein U-like protein 1 isoform X2 n=1 Tax=Erigeron canadensis TaxID=72917 RepID=UPI001CB97A1F|nr:heterogeneous nuclear ribonucleoprotein U-like protein 1 isoform X2 [Erigeron canadensis]
MSWSSSVGKRERNENQQPWSLGKKPRLHHSLRVVLNPADSDLGITRGKYCFSCRIVSGQPVDMDDTPLDQRHLCQVGISRGDDKVGNLGETQHSFGFGGDGKLSNSGRLSTYGESFGIGDTILCAVDLETKPAASIGFAKNGKWLGSVSYIDAGSIFFPHVLLKNVVVQLQFSCEDGLVPQDGYRPWGSALADGNGLMGPSFTDVCNCELIMMVGLPASGKTTWAERWVSDHPEKRYILLGTDLALDQMKVPGLIRKQNYGERFDHLMKRATSIFNTLLTRASKTPRNFIIDQTNVYKSARKRKLKPFANYQKIAVVAFPKPEDLKARSEKRFREMRKEVPAEAVNEMLANFVLPKSKDMPRTDEYFDQVVYLELNETESKRCLEEMKGKLQPEISLSTYSRENSLLSYSSNPVRYSQENLLQSHQSSAHQIFCESSTGISHTTSRHNAQRNSSTTYDTSPLKCQTPSGSYLSQPILPHTCQNNPTSGKFLPRDDFNHRRSYSGYEHRATAPMGIFGSHQRNNLSNGSGVDYHTSTSNGSRLDYHTSSNETMDLSPRYTANLNSHSTLIERYPTSSAPGATQVDMHPPTQSRYLPPTSFAQGSTYGTPCPMNVCVNHNMHTPNLDGYHSTSRYY